MLGSTAGWRQVGNEKIVENKISREVASRRNAADLVSARAEVLQEMLEIAIPSTLEG